ncbi:MAG: hypothetical protein ACRDHM_09665 [Actinomycetota bacterium]
MRRGLLFVATAVAAMTTLAGTAMAVPPPAPDGFQYVSADEHIVMAIVCPGTGTCTATYALSQNPGTESVGSTLSATPLEYIFHATGSSEPFGTFMADETLEPEYVLRADEPISGQVTMGGFIGGAEFGADYTVEVVLTGTRVGPGSSSVALGSATVNKLVVTPDSAGRVYPFTFSVPADLDGVKVRDLTLDLYVRGISVLQNGFVDGEGGSWFDLPYYKLVPAA